MRIDTNIEFLPDFIYSRYCDVYSQNADIFAVFYCYRFFPIYYHLFYLYIYDIYNIQHNRLYMLILINTIIHLLTLFSLMTSTSSQQIKLHAHPVMNILNPCQNPVQTSSTNITMGNCYNYVYYIQVGIGTPAQQFLVQFDTGSNTLWVPTTKISANGFKQTSSSTFYNTNSAQSLTYADNSVVSGLVGYDYVVVGPLIKVNNSILFVNSETNFQMDGNVSGIVGMGYTNQPNFLDLAHKAGQISTNIFALELGSTPNTSSLYYNQIPSSILSNTLYTKVFGNQQWSANLIGVYTNDTDLTQYASNIAIIDSGTSLFYLNTDLFNQFQTLYLQSCQNSTSYYLCNCSRKAMPIFKFLFPGVQVQINVADYVVSLNQGMCQVYVGTLSTEANHVLLGDTLFRNNVITFNKNNASIGFYNRQNTTVSVSIVGSQHHFQISQYVMGGFTILFMIISLFLLCFVQIKDLSYLREPLISQTPTQKTMYGQNIELTEIQGR